MTDEEFCILSILLIFPTLEGRMAVLRVYRVVCPPLHVLCKLIDFYKTWFCKNQLLLNQSQRHNILFPSSCNNKIVNALTYGVVS